MNGIGPKLPLFRDNSSGNYSLIKLYKEEVKQNFKNLMLTSQGERMMMPDFGVGLRHFLFEPDHGLIVEIRQRIYSQVKKYMPFVQIKKIEFNPARNNRDNPNMLSIKIEYGVPNMNLNSTLILF